MLLVPLPVLTNTSALLLPTAAAAASAWSPATRENANRKLTGVAIVLASSVIRTACQPTVGCTAQVVAVVPVEQTWFVSSACV